MPPDDDRQPGHRARRFRRIAAWLLLTAALGGLGAGIALGQGLPIAGGLVLAGISGHLLAPDGRRPTHPR
ncbi:hypothetical protein AB0D04_15850 [Streptomyces sp. NPDC048483]|uniref:hypothetical protein n=1 Tax=Streptomyces sp. NPDC048483 TaxID=3154927 RepID=UPI00343D47C3